VTGIDLPAGARASTCTELPILERSDDSDLP
jgi:hypothetical protein